MSGIITDISKRVPMSRIDQRLWVGDAEDHRMAKNKGIEAILNVARDVEYTPPDGIEYQHMRLTDDGNNDSKLVLEAVDTLAGFLQQGKKTLIHCRSGVSRAPSIAALYYNIYENWPLNAALEAIKQKRPIVDPGVPFWLTATLLSSRWSPKEQHV